MLLVKISIHLAKMCLRSEASVGSKRGAAQTASYLV